MIKRFMSIQKSLRIILLILAGISLLSLMLSQALSIIVNSKANGERLRRSQHLRTVLESIEFNGLDDTTKEIINQYMDGIGGYSNLIITNDSGRVIYHANDGYMPNVDSFIVVINQERPWYAYILDSETNIKYRINFDEKYNSIRLAEYSREVDNSINLFSKVEELEKNIQDYQYSNLPEKNMNYAYIGSKEWNVYTIQDELRTNSQYSQFNQSKMIINRIGTCAYVFFWLLLPVWVFLDAKKRNYKPALWGIITIISNVVGLIIYIMTRQEPSACQGCGEPLDEKYIVCPYCGTSNREICSSCKSIIEKKWVACPYCGNQIADKLSGEIEQ